MVDEEDREYRSIERREEIELSKVIVLLPPERLKREKKEIELPLPKSKKEKEEEKVALPGPLATQTQNIIVIAAVLLSVVALIVAFTALISFNEIKKEFGIIAIDLESYKEAMISFESDLAAAHTVSTELPIKDVISPIEIPIYEEIEKEGTMTIYHPIYGAQTIPFDVKVTLSDTIKIDPTILSEERKMKLNYTIESKEGKLLINIKGGDLWTKELENILDRIKNLSK